LATDEAQVSMAINLLMDFVYHSTLDLRVITKKKTDTS